ncbi:hypothetical protein NQZ79_g836 [Umbelopsis isabellina]|nr:hypothetical protein NQZ79_g836 [Umbelopsis isabellina]
MGIWLFWPENHPLPRDLWNQTCSQSLSSADIVRLKDELLGMRGVLDTLIGNLDAIKPLNDHHNGGEQAREETATYKRLSTNDMAEFLGESKDTSTPTAKISSPKPVSPSTQRQAGFAYPQAVAPTSAIAPATPSSYQYQSPYQQQIPVAKSHPQQQNHQQIAPPPPSSQPGYASAPSFGTSGYASNAPAPSPGSYMHSAHPPPATQTGPDYYQNRPPPIQTNHTQSNPGSSNYPQQGPPPHAPQQAPPRPAYGYSESGRWR